MKKTDVEEIKIAIEKSQAETTRHFNVVAEAQDKKWKLVAEQYEGITKNIDGMKGDIVGIKGKISEIKYTLDGHTEMIGNLALDMTIVKEQLEILNSGMKQKVDVKEFESLQRRVLALEKVRK